MALDFTAIKEAAAARYEKVFTLAGLQMKRTHPDQWRGPCPISGSGGDRILVYTISIQRWCCHCKVCSPNAGKGGKTKGGDLVALLAHATGIGNIAAGQLLQDTFMQPEKPKRRGRAAASKTKAKPEPAVGGTEEYSIIDHMQRWR